MKNKKCRKVERWIGPYFDGEATVSRSARVEAHLRECSACRSELERLKQTRDLIRQSVSAMVAESAPDFEAQLQGLRQKMGQPEKPEKKARQGHSPWGRWFRGARILVPSAAVVALMAVFVFTIYKRPVPVIKTASSNECFIESIDAGSSTVMLFQTHGSRMTVIWLSGNGPSDEEAADKWTNTSI